MATKKKSAEKPAKVPAAEKPAKKAAGGIEIECQAWENDISIECAPDESNN
jgi:hypothetical protein